MSDRELLEKAAKAAGYEVRWNEHHPWNGQYEIKVVPEPKAPYSKYLTWNPLHDDGDALRLQIKLNLGLVPIEDGRWACVTWDHDDEVTLAADHDPKRAIVRAAAAIAESKEPK